MLAGNIAELVGVFRPVIALACVLALSACDDDSVNKQKKRATARIEVTAATSLTVDENDNAGAGTQSISLNLTRQPSSEVSLAVTTSDAAELKVSQSSQDTPAESVTVFFSTTDWDAPHDIVITGQQDFLVDGSQSVTVMSEPAISADSAFAGLNPVDLSVTVNDVDSTGISMTPTTGLTTSEAGGRADVNVSLATRPTAEVVLTFTSSDVTEGKVSVGSLVGPAPSVKMTFNEKNFRTAQTLTLNGQDDEAVDGDVPYTVNLDAQSSDPVYGGAGTAALSATNTDDPDPVLPPSGDAMLLKIGAGETKLYEQTWNLNSPFDFDPLIIAAFEVFSPELSTSLELIRGISSTGQIDFMLDVTFLGNFPGIYTDSTQQMDVYLRDSTLSDPWGYFSRYPDTFGSIDVQQYGGVNQPIAGTFNVQVCGISDLMAGNCGAGPLTLTGVFNVWRTSDKGGDVYVKGSLDTQETETHWVNTLYNPGGINYMEARGDSGATYQIELLCLTDDVDLHVWSNNYDMNTAADCASENTGTTTELCTGIAPSSPEFFFWVERGVGTPGNPIIYDIRASRTDSGWQVPEGTQRCPLVVSGFPYTTGTVDTEISYYKASALAATTAYTVDVTGLSENADLFIYPDGNFDDLGANPICGSANGGTSNESCAATSNGAGEIFIMVRWIDPSGGAGVGTPYTLDVY